MYSNLNLNCFIQIYDCLKYVYRHGKFKMFKSQKYDFAGFSDFFLNCDIILIADFYKIKTLLSLFVKQLGLPNRM